MLNTQPYPNPEPTQPHTTLLNTTPPPYTYMYPTRPPSHPTPTFLLSCHTLPCPVLPYPTLPYPPAVYVVRSDVSVVLLSISVSESGLILSIRSVSFRSVKLKAIGTDRMNSVKSVDSMPELFKLYNCRLNKCRIVTCKGLLAFRHITYR